MKIFNPSKKLSTVIVLVAVLLLISFIFLGRYMKSQEASRLTFEQLALLNETELNQHCGLFALGYFCPEYCNWDASNKNQHCVVDLSALEAARSAYTDYLAYLIKKGSITIDEIAINESTEILNAVTKKNPEGLASTSDESILIESVRTNPESIQYIESPSETVQLLAVKENGCALKYIQSPTEAVLQQGVQNCASVLSFLKNPSDEVVRLAIKSNPENIEYLDDPDESLISLAMSQGYVLSSMNMTFEEYDRIWMGILRNMAPTLDENHLNYAEQGRYIPLPPKSDEKLDPEYLRLLIKRNVAVIEQIRHISPELVADWMEDEKEEILSVINDPQSALAKLSKPYDEEEIMELLFINPYIIKYIDEQTERMQVFAVLVDPNVLQYLKNPPKALASLSYEDPYCANFPTSDSVVWRDATVTFMGNMPKEEALKIIEKAGLRNRYYNEDYGKGSWLLNVSMPEGDGQYLDCKLRSMTTQFESLM